MCQTGTEVWKGGSVRKPPLMYIYVEKNRRIFNKMNPGTHKTQILLNIARNLCRLEEHELQIFTFLRAKSIRTYLDTTEPILYAFAVT